MAILVNFYYYYFFYVFWKCILFITTWLLQKKRIDLEMQQEWREKMPASRVHSKPKQVKTKMLTHTPTNTDGRHSWAGGGGDGIDVAAKPRVNSPARRRLTKQNNDRLSLGHRRPSWIQVFWRAAPPSAVPSSPPSFCLRLLLNQTTRILIPIQIV